MKKKIIGIIPAREGSKEIKLKNLQRIGNKSLLQIAIEESSKSKLIDNLILTSESEKIINHAKKFNINIPFTRSKKLAGDKSKTFDVIRDALLRCEKIYDTKYDIAVVLQPTTPFRKYETIDKAIKKLIKNNLDACISIKKTSYPTEWNLKIDNDILTNIVPRGNLVSRRQDSIKSYQPAGSVYVLTTKCLMNLKNLLPNKNTSGIIVSEKEGINIDNKDQLDYARYLYKS